MGQKSNPNSFQQQKSKTSLWSSYNKLDYAVLLKNNFEVIQVIHSLFESQGCLIKECFFLRSKELNSSTLFVSFLPIRSQRKTLKSKSKSKNSDAVAL